MEALAQLGGIVMIDPSNAAEQNNFFFGGVDNLRWRKPVVPGDVLVRARPPPSLPCPPALGCAALPSRGLGPVERCRCVPPLQMMRVDVTKFNKRFGICKMNAKAYVGATVVCDAELTLVMGK